MGNSLGCSRLGERLMSAARDGDIAEVENVLKASPKTAKFCSFGVRISPLHFAAAKGHREIVQLLLQHGANPNLRNYTGQTPLMLATRFGHWQVVQMLLIYRAEIHIIDQMSGRTALHYAAAFGAVQCLRLLLSDLIPSEPRDPEAVRPLTISADLADVVNANGDCEVTPLHLASLNGQVECVRLLLDVGANVNALTGMGCPIGAFSTPLHYAACSGNATTCKMLLSRGAKRGDCNSNGWSPAYVARLWKRVGLVPLLAIGAAVELPPVLHSRYLALPLNSIMNIARQMEEEGVFSSVGKAAESEACGICLEFECSVSTDSCQHKLCAECALHLCLNGSVPVEPREGGWGGTIPCPFCRQGITAFTRLPPETPRQPSLKIVDIFSISSRRRGSRRAELEESWKEEVEERRSRHASVRGGVEFRDGNVAEEGQDVTVGGEERSTFGAAIEGDAGERAEGEGEGEEERRDRIEEEGMGSILGGYHQGQLSDLSMSPLEHTLVQSRMKVLEGEVGAVGVGLRIEVGA